MLHTRLNLRRPLIVLDTETTSLDPETARIIELGLQAYTAEGLQKEWRTYINPGIDIPPETTAIHGITDEMVRGCMHCSLAMPMHGDAEGLTLFDMADGPRADHPFAPWPSFAQIAPGFVGGSAGCDFAGKNIRYDLRVIAAEMTRAGVAWSYAAAKIIDADRLESIGEPRTLSDLYRKHTGQELEGAHGALSDVQGTVMVINAQLDKYSILPRDVDALHALQWPGWIDPEGKFRFVDDEPTCMFGKYKLKSMRAIPRDYWNFILTSNFSTDVKKLASDAKLGIFPVRNHDV